MFTARCRPRELAFRAVRDQAPGDRGFDYWYDTVYDELEVKYRELVVVTDVFPLQRPLVVALREWIRCGMVLPLEIELLQHLKEDAVAQQNYDEAMALRRRLDTLRRRSQANY